MLIVSALLFSRPETISGGDQGRLPRLGKWGHGLDLVPPHERPAAAANHLPAVNHPADGADPGNQCRRQRRKHQKLAKKRD